MSHQPSKSMRSNHRRRRARRFDYPEPLYTAPRSLGQLGSPPVSPLTRSLILEPSEPYGSCAEDALNEQPFPCDSVDDLREHAALLASVGAALSAASPQRSIGKLRGGIDSAIDGLPAGDTRDGHAQQHRGTQTDFAQALHAVSPNAYVGTRRNRLSNIFTFGQESCEDEPAQEPKKKRWPTHFWSPKSDPSSVLSDELPTGAVKAAETQRQKRSRFDSVRKSVTDLSASLKQIAGRKRSREESEEPTMHQAPVKCVRIVAPTPPQLPEPVIEPLWPDVALPDVVWPPPPPPPLPVRRRPPIVPDPNSLELDDQGVQALINEIAAETLRLHKDLERPPSRAPRIQAGLSGRRV